MLGNLPLRNLAELGALLLSLAELQLQDLKV